MIHLDFYLLVFFSLILPIAIYAFLYLRKAISKATVLMLGLALIALAGADLVLLRQLAHLASAATPLVGGQFFSSEISIALYLLPALFAGVGINLISHVLITHLVQAEARFEHSQSDD